MPTDAKSTTPDVAGAAQRLLDRIDNMTTEDFSKGGERQEREALRDALAGKVPQPETDFTFHNGGSVGLLWAKSDAAQAWADENLPADALRFAGGIAIEARYVSDILEGIEADGLTVGAA